MKKYNFGPYSKEHLDARWEEAMSSNRPWRLSIKIEKIQHWMERIKQHHSILRHLNITPDTKVMSAGCAIGHLAPYFNFDNYLGIDIYKPAIEYAKTMYPSHQFLSEDMTQISYPDNTFEWIICAGFKPEGEMFEHLNAWGHNIVSFSYTPANEYMAWNKQTKKILRGLA